VFDDAASTIHQFDEVACTIHQFDDVASTIHVMMSPCRGVVDAEEVLLLEVGAHGVDAQRAGDERHADGREGGGGRHITQGEEDDARHEHGGGDPLLTAVSEKASTWMLRTST